MSIADTLFYQNRIHEITFRFARDMLELRNEDPNLATAITKEQWANCAWAAKQSLGKRIAKQVEAVEQLLVTGDFDQESQSYLRP